jgi:hypothetical protein
MMGKGDLKRIGGGNTAEPAKSVESLFGVAA